MCKLLFSTTISEQVFEEISVLMPGITTVEGTEKIYNPVRDHIQMTFRHDVEMDKRLEEIATYLKDGGFNPSLSRAIIFVKSRKRVEECAMVMTDTMKEVFGENCDFADKIGAFHAGMDAEDRKDTYEKYKTGEIVILFATKAFGMGMDIPDIHFIVHYSPPGTFEDFLQEIGRAGRNENLRLKAGFNNDRPIQTLCLTRKADFARLKDQLHNSRISWHEVKEVQTVAKNYIAGIKPLETDTELPVAVPFNLYSVENLLVDDELDNKFRIGLYWLERLERIKLGYFTITHIEFDYKSLIYLENQISRCPDDNSRKACRAILELMPKGSLPNPVLQLSIASLRSLSKLSLDKLFAALLKCHSLGILKLNQNIVIEPTKFRREEVNYCREIEDNKKKYPALRVLFSFVSKIMDSVPLTDSKLFEGEELDEFLQESITEIIDYDKLPWEKRGMKNLN
ncbi:MAG: hypothetical protein LUH15_15045 [Tannerellaceae bacterium]|nr:hypothetical protein [Tannerellaceae bacterium]